MELWESSLTEIGAWPQPKVGYCVFIYFVVKILILMRKSLLKSINKIVKKQKIRKCTVQTKECIKYTSIKQVCAGAALMTTTSASFPHYCRAKPATISKRELDMQKGVWGGDKLNQNTSLAENLNYDCQAAHRL